MISTSASSRIAIVQGNIEQAEKWDDKFRRSTTEKYIDLSIKLKPEINASVCVPSIPIP